MLNVSLVQSDVVWQDPPKNRERLAALIAPLAGRTDLIILPEMFTTGFSMAAAEWAEPVGGPTLDWMRGQARGTGGGRHRKHHYRG